MTLSLTRIARLGGVAAAGAVCAALSGCVVAPPVDAYATSYPAYSTVYGAPAYGAPVAPVYGGAVVGAAPVVVTPSIGFFGTFGRSYHGRPGWGRPGFAPPPRGIGPGAGFRPGGHGFGGFRR